MNENNNSHSPAVVKFIAEKVQSLLANKEYKKAAEILKESLQKHPHQKELIKLYSDLRTQYKNDKIQKLQEEAIMFLRSGADDKAQQKLREIFKLDPTRTELKDSFKKTRSEILKEYDKRVLKMETVNFCTRILIGIIIVICSISLWAWWSNNRHLNKSEQFIDSGDLFSARQELNKCNQFPSGRKEEINLRLKTEINKLIKLAHESIESKDFQKAKAYFDLAAQAAENITEINDEIKICQQMEKQWEEESARQQEEREKQGILSQKALAAKQKFENVLKQSLANEADTAAKDIFEMAENKAHEAENLFSQDKFESAEAGWTSAAEDCDKALKIAVKIISDRNNALAFKQKSVNACECGKKINASAEANEVWLEAVKISESAEQQFISKKLDAAKELWLSAEDKYNEAIQITKQSPQYKKALMFVKKWQLLKQGLSEEEIRNFLGRPGYIQADSDKCIWYYQSGPESFKNDDGNYQCHSPQYGYISFGTLNIQILIDRNNEAYQKHLASEDRIHESFIANLNKQIENEYSRHRSFKPSAAKIIAPTYSRSNKKGRGSSVNNSDAIRAENQRHESQIANLKKAINKENKRHIDRLDTLKSENEEKINDLANGLSPIEPSYIVSEWITPDMNNMFYFMENENKEKKLSIKEPQKWQVPVRWRALKLNIREEDVCRALGTPDDKSIEGGKIIYRYGHLAEYGFLLFEDCADSTRRLRYWKEPLWTYVTHELQKENLFGNEQAVEIVQIDEPNEPAI